MRIMNTFWKRALRRDLPVIAIGAAMAAGTIVGWDEAPALPAAADAGTLAVEAPMTAAFFSMPTPTAPTASSAPTKPFELTAIGTQPSPSVAQTVSNVSRGIIGALSDIDHKYVSAWVDKLTGKNKQSLATNLDRMEPYRPMIEKKLAAKGMPQELVYLALIESGGNPKATSPVRAKGLWQFMASTAKHYGLTVKGKVDERTNPAKATDAALEYLSDLHDQLGSWYLAAAAYNTGPGRVRKELKKVTGKTKGTDEDFFKIASRLPKETRDYVPKLVAVARIAKEPDKFGLTD